MILCEWDTPEGHPGQYCVHLYAFLSYRCLSSQFQFSLSAVSLVYLSQCLGLMSPRVKTLLGVLGPKESICKVRLILDVEKPLS
jgi:hypothetical protein